MSKQLPDVLRCDVCKAEDPKVVVLPLRSRACGRTCFEHLQERYAAMILRHAEIAAGFQ
jgi:hypothetical protein